MKSIWKNTTKPPVFNSLQGDIKTDVLIIGGGITGILSAYLLDNAGVDYVLAEADSICSGVTRNTTAKLTFQHGLIYDKLVRTKGESYAKMYLDANQAAIGNMKKIISKADCDFTECASYVYSLNNREKIEKEVAALNRLGVNAEFCERTQLPFKTAGAVRVENQAQFNPLKFIYSIAENLNIYENTRVTQLMPFGAETEHGKIRAKKIIVATHFPFISKHGSYFLKMYQHRSYVVALENAAKLDGMYVDEGDKGLSFRNYKDLLLLGGGSHRTGKNGGNWQELVAFAKKYYPEATEICRWATQDCMTLDRVPYIGNYSLSTPNLFVATGFNKWGISSAMVAAMILCDMIQEKENAYAPVFSPHRSILHPQLAVNISESLINFLTPTAPRCPHMGCALKYNKREHSWDCPCHGSRFSKQGKLLNNPANANINKKI